MGGLGLRLFMLSLLLTVSPTPGTVAQSVNGTDITKQQSEILALLQSLDGTPSLGDPKARVAIVEFGDYQCPYCGQHAQNVMPQIVADYVKTGKVRYFFVDTPVEAIHPQAFKASEAALCAGDQGKYWEMHDRLFKNQQALGPDGLSASANALGLDIPTFQRCLDLDAHAVRIRKNIQDAVKLGARGTPTFLVLDSAGSAKQNVTTFSGFKPFDTFQQILEKTLSTDSKGGRQ